MVTQTNLQFPNNNLAAFVYRDNDSPQKSIPLLMTISCIQLWIRTIEFDIYEKIPANLAYCVNSIRYPIIKGIIAKKCDYKFIQETALWQFTIHTLFIITKVLPQMSHLELKIVNIISSYKTGVTQFILCKHKLI